jgi:hypothetical protein
LIQISDRDDFKDKFAALMAADVSLMHAGIDPKSEVIPDMIDAFLDQFEAITPKPAWEPTGTVIGHTIRRKGDKRIMNFDGKTVHEGWWIATSTLIRHITSKPEQEKYEIVPVRTAD